MLAIRLLGALLCVGAGISCVSQASQQVPLIHARADHVVVDLLIDSANWATTPLQVTDVEIRVDGKKEAVLACQPADDVSDPQDIFLAIDMPGALSATDSSFPENLARSLDELPSHDRVAVVAFSRPGEADRLVQPLTLDRSLVRFALLQLAKEHASSAHGPSNRGFTGMDTLEYLLRIVPDRPTGDQSVILLISDDITGAASNSTSGWNAKPQEVHTYASVTSELQARNIAVNLLQLPGSAAERLARADESIAAPYLRLLGVRTFPLRGVVRDTGGIALSMLHEDPKESIQSIFGKMRRRYLVDFRPPVQDGKMHKITLQLSAKAMRRLGSPRISYRHAYRAPEGSLE